MSWLSRLLGGAPSPPPRFTHVGVLVGGTAVQAELGAGQLRMMGIGGHRVAGTTHVDEIRGTLSAATGHQQWTRVQDLAGVWVLVIPEDLFAASPGRFEGLINGAVIDGRMPAELRNAFSSVSPSAVEEVERLIAQIPIPSTGGVPPPT